MESFYMPRRTAGQEQLGRAALLLLRFRDQAGLSIREMADELGWHPHTRYQYYETRFKKDHLPAEIFFPIKEILVRRGVPEGEINRLLHKGIYEELTKVNAKLDRIERALAAIAAPEDLAISEPPYDRPPKRN